MGTDLGGSALSSNGLFRAHDLAFQVRVLVGAPLAQRATILVLWSTV